MHKDKKAPGRAVAPPPNPAFMRMLIPAGIIPVLYTSGVLLMHGFAPGALESWLAFSHAATMLPGGVCSSLSYVESTMVAGGFAERVALVQNIAASQILASAVFLLAFAVVFALAFRRSRPWFAAKADEASNALFPEAGHENWSLALLFAVVIWLVCAGFSAYPVLSLLDGSAITIAPFAGYRSVLNLFLFSAMMAGLPFSVAGMATFSPVVIAFARRAAHARRPVG